MKARILLFVASSRFWEMQLQLTGRGNLNLYLLLRIQAIRLTFILHRLEIIFFFFFFPQSDWCFILTKSSCSANHFWLLKIAPRLVVLVRYGGVNEAFLFIRWLSLTVWLMRSHDLTPQVNLPRNPLLPSPCQLGLHTFMSRGHPCVPVWNDSLHIYTSFRWTSAITLG